MTIIFRLWTSYRPVITLCPVHVTKRSKCGKLLLGMYETQFLKILVCIRDLFITIVQLTFQPGIVIKRKTWSFIIAKLRESLEDLGNKEVNVNNILHFFFSFYIHNKSLVFFRFCKVVRTFCNTNSTFFFKLLHFYVFRAQRMGQACESQSGWYAYYVLFLLSYFTL